jgi:hypothetical protein
MPTGRVVGVVNERDADLAALDHVFDNGRAKN